MMETKNTFETLVSQIEYTSEALQKIQSLISQFQITDNQVTIIVHSLIAKSHPIGQSVSAQFKGIAHDKLFNRLSFTSLPRSAWRSS